MKHVILDEIIDIGQQLGQIQNKNERESNKDFRNNGFMAIAFCYMIGLLFMGIFMSIMSKKLTIQTKLLVELVVCIFIVIGGIFACIKSGAKFYSAEKIAEVIRGKSEVKFLTLKTEAFNTAKTNISMKKEMKMIEELSKHYNIKEKPFNMENLEERIQFAEDEVLKKEEELKSATYKYVVSDASYQLRSKKDLIFLFFMKSVFVYMACFMLLSLPMMMTEDKSQNVPYTWIPLVISFIPMIMFIIMNLFIIKEDLKAFKILNTCNLPSKPEYYETYALKIKMEEAQKVYQNFVEIAYDFFNRIERIKEQENSD